MKITKDKVMRGIRSPFLITKYVRTAFRDKVLSRYSDTSPYPLDIIFIVNTVCNAKCQMCDIGKQNKNTNFYNIMSKNSAELSFDHFRKVVDDVTRYGTHIQIRGTEPLLKNDLPEFISYCSSRGLRTSIATNGYLLPQMAEKLVSSGLHKIQVSLDGPREINDEIRGLKGGFDRVKEGVGRITQLKKEQRKNEPIVKISCVIFGKNYEILNEALSDFKTIKGVDQVTFKHYNFIDRQIADLHNRFFGKILPVSSSCDFFVDDNKKIDFDKYSSIIESIEMNESQSFPLGVQFMPKLDRIELKKYYLKTTEKLAGYRRCNAPWSSCAIMANGDVIEHMRGFYQVMGNIKDEPLIKIWNNKKYRAFRQTMIRNNGALPACSRCCGIMWS